MFALVRQLSQATGVDNSRELSFGAILLNELPARIRSLVHDKTSHSHNITPSELLNLLADIIPKEAVMDVIESAFPSSAGELVDTTIETSPKSKMQQQSKASHHQRNHAAFSTAVEQIEFSLVTSADVPPTQIKSPPPPLQPASQLEQPSKHCALSLPQPETNPPATLFMCAAVTIFHPDDPSQHIKALALLDSGSDRSYVPNEVADALNLSPLKSEDVQIFTFGTKNCSTCAVLVTKSAFRLKMGKSS
ncbi:hypothetical protein KIN20_012923 [Parelaphostrongylus tenuis]|uniref:Peptidase aspartic putative domain-containing protein n=1 Tax=Parelaphostrongylus tenuis TaxID=148309 RepID=A0AAD5MFV1_PARTN|nr:hypothetical protein KIN20_012923 [Parelaphostrongylus tenuis]